MRMTLSSIQSQPINSTQIEFTKIYNDGSVPNVSNGPVFSTYPVNDRKISFRFPDINDVDRLLGAAQKLAGSKVNTAGELTIERGLEFAAVESNLNEELSFLMSKGWVSKKSVGDKRSLTLKGALLMTWQLCWPVKLFLNSRDVKSSMKALDNA